MTPCILVGEYSRFEEIYCFHRQDIGANSGLWSVVQTSYQEGGDDTKERCKEKGPNPANGKKVVRWS